MEDRLNIIVSKAYKEFLPSEKEVDRMESVFGAVVEKIQKKASRLRINVEIKPGGSFSKNTWISGQSDIDIFVVFDDEESTRYLKKISPDGFKETRGTRVYFRGTVSGISVEIVPIVRFSDPSKVINSIDFSILHADYVNKKMTSSMRRDIIILKKFCRANRCYGSETYMHGFSGYALELLIINYGSLRQLFNAVSSWNPTVYIDSAHVYRSKEEAISAFSSNLSPVLLIDPTNPKRNICASLSVENLSRFVFAVKSFLLNPSFSFFVEDSLEKLITKRSKARGTMLFKMSTRISGEKDRFLSKYNRQLNMLLHRLEKTGIDVYQYDVSYKEKEAELFLEVGKIPVSSTMRVIGPKVWLNEHHLSRFLKAHKGAYVCGEFVSYDKPYKTKDIKKFILDEVKQYMSTSSILKK